MLKRTLPESLDDLKAIQNTYAKIRGSAGRLVPHTPGPTSSAVTLSAEPGSPANSRE